jgi:hypothetical protein
MFGQLSALPLSLERAAGQTGIGRENDIGHPVHGFFLGAFHDLCPMTLKAAGQRLPTHSTEVNVSLRVAGGRCASGKNIWKSSLKAR